jgi:energy-coupling factor transporter transmembrane protein EcfT
LEPDLHPTAALLVWLAAVLAVQFLGYTGLGLLAAGLLLARPALWRAWLAYVRRARWLLLSLWLILAYNTPGEALADQAWAPTYEGVAEASLQAVRLVGMLGCLAWLFGLLGRDGLVSALAGLLRPLQGLGLDTMRLVVRLSLVLENLQVAPEKGAWKKMLAGDPAFAGGPDVLQVSQSAWMLRDTFVVMGCASLLLGAILL